ncbi:DUF1837 domain-containing protein [Pseudomonas alliivorans]|nr:DUF1837 domain-containing protein [Pseudomonas alliivorans]MEE4792652.1 DUF1837 domain-containing protein [Pseudomonas alliivorans]MEE4798885.1 DUF1837 domain-containing protein [Pseudomonas alliivorans]MEE4810472.1 DUF1837 domain-containing protein [Pseudomonas alliivorans]MEE4825557.1 DUF1837 domain-containing protein [Pseudomonas alliivorans]
MEDLKSEKWEKYISTDLKWVDKFFIQHPSQEKIKTKVRVLSVKFSGTEQETLALVEYLADSIKHFIFGRSEIQKFQLEGVEPFRRAAAHFGSTNPVMDGKYGELMLYMLVEAVLKAPMVSHKLRLLTNVNDQVKGGDGVFFGKYGDEMSIFIGESKIHQSFSKATDSSLESLDRFHQNYSSSALSHELFIARSNISENFSLDQLETIYNAFLPGTDEYQSCIKTHPVLLVYDDAGISKIEDKCTSKSHAEQLVEKWISKNGLKLSESINGKVDGYKKLKKVHLDFFLIPMSDVGGFKKSLYKAIHNIEFKEDK